MWVKVAENHIENIADASRVLIKDRFRAESDDLGGLIQTTQFLSSELVAILPGSRSEVLASFSAEDDGGEEAAKKYAASALKEVEAALRKGEPLVDLTRIKHKGRGSSAPFDLPMPVGVSRRR